MWYQVIGNQLYGFSDYVPEIGDEATMNARGIFKNAKDALDYGIEQKQDELNQLHIDYLIVKSDLLELEVLDPKYSITWTSKDKD